MSELISQLELLRLMVKGRKPPQSAFSNTGLDAELFAQIYKQFRPGLEHLLGFRPIMDDFKNRPSRSPIMVIDAAMEEFDQVIDIARMGIGPRYRDGYMPLDPVVRNSTAERNPALTLIGATS